MNNFSRGDIYLVGDHMAEGHEQQKTRYWVIISKDLVNSQGNVIVGVPLTTKGIHKPPIKIAVKHQDKAVIALPLQLRALDKRRFIRYSAIMGSSDLCAIENAVIEILDLS